MSDEHIDRQITLRRSQSRPIDPNCAALLIIDMQEYQVRKTWTCYQLGTAANPGLLDYFMERVETIVEPNIVRLVAAARKVEMPLVFTKLSSHDKQGRDFAPQIQWLNKAAVKAVGKPVFPHLDDPASAIVPALSPRDGDIVITKTTSGVFTGTELERLLKNMGQRQLVVCGVVTNMCVEGSARAGSELGFDVTVVDDACAAWSESVHVASLRSFEMIFGAVTKTDALIDQLLSGHADARRAAETEPSPASGKRTQV